MTAPQGWITTTETAQRLGVKRATLYSYVSRGVLRSRRQPGQQESLFDRVQVEQLGAATREPSRPAPLLRFRSVATAVSGYRDGELCFRRMPVAQLCDELTVEEAVAFLMPADSFERAPQEALPGLRGVLLDLPLRHRVPVAVALLGAHDPLRQHGSPAETASAATRVLDGVVDLLRPLDHGQQPPSLVGRLFLALSGRPGTTREIACLEALFVVMMDHGLTASTVAARVAASTRAPFYDCLAAAYGTMAGPLHGAAPRAAHDLLAEVERTGDAEHALTSATSRHGHTPGFGHLLYADEDPRATLVLEHLAGVRGSAPHLQAVRDTAEVVRQHSGLRPNVDLAIAAVVRTFGLPPDSGVVVFQLARTVGVVAHVIEEYAEQPLRWRGRATDG